jgi:hypothetical protein
VKRSTQSALVAAMALACAAASGPRSSTSGAVLGQENAAWSRSLFFRGYAPTTGETLRPENVTAFASTLRDGGIGYAYLFSGPFQADGSLPAWATSSTARTSIERMRAVHPALDVLPWVGGLQGKTVRLDDPAWRAAALDALAGLFAALPIRGVHLDFELVLPDEPYLRDDAADPAAAAGYSAGLVAFHEEARLRFPNRFLSSVVVSTASQTRPWKRKPTLAEATAIARAVDQLAFLFYDTAIDDRARYEQGLDEQLGHFRTIKDALGDRAPQLLLALGTFVNEPPLRKYRNLAVESLPDTLALTRRRLAALSPGRRLVDGLAIYGEWTTDAAEWRQLRDGWTAAASD